MKLYYNGKSDPAAAVIRANGLPHTDTQLALLSYGLRLHEEVPVVGPFVEVSR